MMDARIGNLFVVLAVLAVVACQSTSEGGSFTTPISTTSQITSTEVALSEAARRSRQVTSYPTSQLLLDRSSEECLAAVYATPGGLAPDDVIAYYRRALPADGWIIVVDRRGGGGGIWQLEAAREQTRLTVTTFNFMATTIGGLSFKDRAESGYELRECSG